MPENNYSNRTFITDLRRTPEKVNQIIRTLIDDTLAGIYLGSVEVKKSSIVNEAGITKFELVLLNNRTGNETQHSRHWTASNILDTDERITEMIEVEVRTAATKFSIKTSQELLQLIKKGPGFEKGVELGLTEIMRSMLSGLKNPNKVQIVSATFSLIERKFNIGLTMSGLNGEYRHRIVLDKESLIQPKQMHTELNKGLTVAIGLGDEKSSVFKWEYFPPRKEKPHQSVEDILKFFSYEHLPPKLQEASKPICEMAREMAMKGKGAELTVALRKLLEAKDCFVRSVL